MIFSEWAMLGSNQRPLPCEVCTIVFQRFLELAKCLQITIFSLRQFSQDFRIFTRLLHGCCTQSTLVRTHPRKRRDVAAIRVRYTSRR